MNRRRIFAIAALAAPAILATPFVILALGAAND